MTHPATHVPQSPATQAHAVPMEVAPIAAPALNTGTLVPDLDLGSLLRFRDGMGRIGQSVQMARMCFDPLYAHERLAVAHATGPDPLRRLAMELFQAYHHRDSRRQRLAA